MRLDLLIQLKYESNTVIISWCQIFYA